MRRLIKSGSAYRSEARAFRRPGGGGVVALQARKVVRRLSLVLLEIGQQLVIPDEERRRAQVRLVVAYQPARDVVSGDRRAGLVPQAAHFSRVPSASPVFNQTL